MKDLIEKRLQNYKVHRQEWLDKQNNYKWNKEERDSGSESYGFYQERELQFTIKIN
jgi:hypothetical protein